MEYDVSEIARVQRGAWRLRCFEGEQLYPALTFDCMSKKLFIANINFCLKELQARWPWLVGKGQ